MKLLYKYPSRGRKSKFFEVINNIHSLARHDDFVIVCSFDNNDTTYNNPEFLERLSKYSKVIPCWGDSENKVAAINRDMNVVDDWDICVVEADDQIWTEPGFDLEIIKAFEQYAPDFDALIHFPDPIAGERLITKSIMGRKYYDRFGYTYFPGYESVCCDNDQMELAILLKKYFFINKVMFNHNHPVWRLAPWDELYIRNESPMHYAKDGELLKERRKNNFGLQL